MPERLKQHLKEKCLKCGNRLELRSVEKTYLRDGEDVFFSVDKKYCTICDEYSDSGNKKQEKPWKRYKGGDTF